eukprot:Skav234363  [mRNA]  locus=scaffold1274:267220:271717:+ [translate_table: standard]
MTKPTLSFDLNEVRDINTICSELRLKDISYMKGKALCFHQKWEEELECMEKIIAWLEEGKDRAWSDPPAVDIEFLNDYGLLTAKPCMYAVNMNKRDFCRKKNKFLKPIFDWVQANSPGSAIIPYCGAFEEELQDMETEEEREKQLAEDGVTSAMPKMISTAFHMVHLINFFTAGPDEVKAWTVRKGFKAPQAAGVIHTDFEKGFIMAEVMSFSDLKELGSEAAVKAWRYKVNQS